MVQGRLIELLRTNLLEKWIDHYRQGGSTPSFLCLPIGFSSKCPRLSSSPIFSAVGPCAVPTSPTLVDCCLREFQVDAHHIRVGYGGTWGSSLEHGSWGDNHPVKLTG